MYYVSEMFGFVAYFASTHFHV